MMNIDDYDQPSTPKKKFPPVEPGTYLARIIQVVVTGRQHETMWNAKTSTSEHQYFKHDGEGNRVKEGNQTVKTSDPSSNDPVINPKVKIVWELPSERLEMEDGEDKPRVLNKDYTISSFDQAGLMKLMNAVNPGSQSMSELAGKACMLGVGLTKSGKNNKITSISAPMKGMEVPEAENEIILFDFNNPEEDSWNKLWAWVQNEIKESVDYEGSAVQKMVESASDSPSPDGGDDFDSDNSPF